MMGLVAGLGENSIGLPVGVQVMGAPFQDRLVLGAMLDLENSFAAQADYPLDARVAPYS